MPVSTDPLPDRPAEQPTAEPSAEQPGEYPKTMVKGEHSRRVESGPQEVRLRQDGWRAADEPPVTRGGFLPPVRQPAASDASAADKPKRRRKSDDAQPTE